MENKFLKSTFVLIISGFITKILGFIIKILYTRIIKTEGISLYSLIIPTYSLVITIATMALPLSISKLISENKYKAKKILVSSMILILIIDLVLMIILFLLRNIICINFLKEEKLIPLFISIIITIPFISMTCIYKGYFLGKQNMFPNAISNIFEQLLRIILIIFIFPLLIKKGIIYAVSGLILLNIFSESLSLLIFKLFMPKLKNSKNNLDTNIWKKILAVSIPNVSGRLIGNIGFFLEPIILTNILLYKGFSSSYISLEYGIYNAYSIALLTMPSFFIMAISSSLVPEISKNYIIGKNDIVKKRYKQSLILSLIIGGFFSLTILLFREKLLFMLYKTNNGSDYIKILAPFFVLFYLEGPLSSTMQALNKSKESFKISTYGVIIKLLSLSLFCYLKFGLLSLVYSEIINIWFVVVTLFYKTNKIISNLDFS